MLILAYFFQCANFALAWICNTYSIIKGMFYIQYVTAWLLVISIFAICGRTVLSKFNLVVLLIIFRRCKNGNRTSVKVFTFEIHNTEGLQIKQACYLASHISKKITGRTYYRMWGWHIIFIQFYVWRYLFLQGIFWPSSISMLICTVMWSWAKADLVHPNWRSFTPNSKMGKQLSKRWEWRKNLVRI